MSTSESKPHALQKRLVSFAAEIVHVSANLPKTLEASHISKQVLRSGTASAANYGEARGAESRSDFIHKLRVVLKELNETAISLQLIVESSLISHHHGIDQNRRRLRQVLVQQCRFTSSSFISNQCKSSLQTAEC